MPAKNHSPPPHIATTAFRSPSESYPRIVNGLVMHVYCAFDDYHNEFEISIRLDSQKGWLGRGNGEKVYIHRQIIAQADSPVAWARAGLIAFIFSIKTPTACTNKSWGGMAPADSMLTVSSKK